MKWKPKEREKFYFVQNGQVVKSKWNKDYYKSLLKTNNVFRTKKEAKG